MFTNIIFFSRHVLYSQTVRKRHYIHIAYILTIVQSKTLYIDNYPNREPVNQSK